MPDFQLAEVNIALAREPLDGPLLADFMAALDPVNARADRADGFVWRMQNTDGDATGIRGFGGDPKLIINMSVWESLDALREFAYRDEAHLAVMRQRRKWFERLEFYMVLWWVPAGHRPTVEEAEGRLQALRDNGPTAHAFTFSSSFAYPDATDQQIDERDLCPA
jgi:heme-degrading monooxygenase HmoA